MPQAIGAQVTFPGRQVVTFSGDGGLSMMLGDLLSLHQHKLPVKIMVFSNSALAFVELEMLAAGILGEGTELVNPDFVGLARSAGMYGVRVEDPADLRGAVTEAFRHDGPALGEFSAEVGIRGQEGRVEGMDLAGIKTPG